MRKVAQICVVQSCKTAVSLDMQEVTKHVLLFVNRAHYWSASERTFIVSGGALNSTHSLTHSLSQLLVAINLKQ